MEVLYSSLKTLVAYRCSFDFTSSTSLCFCSFELIASKQEPSIWVFQFFKPMARKRRAK